MRFRVQSESTGTHALLSAVPGEYDGFPAPSELLVDSGPQYLSADRVAVGAALIFGPWISGEVQFESAVSPLVASSIREYLGMDDLAVGPVELSPRALPPGSRTAHISVDAWQRAVWSTGEIGFSSIGMHLSAGALRSASSLAVVSNAGLLAGARPEARAFEAHLGLAVLYAEDLGVAYLAMEGILSGASAGLPAVRALLSSTRLGLLHEGL